MTLKKSLSVLVAALFSLFVTACPDNGTSGTTSGTAGGGGNIVTSSSSTGTGGNMTGGGGAISSSSSSSGTAGGGTGGNAGQPCNPHKNDPQALSTTCEKYGCECLPTAVSGPTWCSDMQAANGGNKICPNPSTGADSCTFGKNECGYDLPQGTWYTPSHCVGVKSLEGTWYNGADNTQSTLTVSYRNGQTVIFGPIGSEVAYFEGVPVYGSDSDPNIDLLCVFCGLRDVLDHAEGKISDDCTLIEYYLYHPGASDYYEYIFFIKG